jgi:hypothetical protein
MMLHGRQEIIRSYQTLQKNNMEIHIEIQSTTFDTQQQTLIIEIQQRLLPKALGGMAYIHMHYILKLQVEPSEDEKWRIVNHSEIHVAQDFLSQMPLVGSFYESTIRNALGQISLAGTSLLEYSGFLDFAPKAVQSTKNTAGNLSMRVVNIASKATEMTTNVIEKTPVPGIMGYIKWGASSLIEKGKGIQISCYSPTCQPGMICYSPTCVRKGYSIMSRESIQDIIKGLFR